MPCPACGFTRAFLLIFRLDIKESFKYNLLPIPLLIYFVIYFVFVMLKKQCIIDNFLLKYRVLVIIVVLFIMLFVELININNPLLYY